MEINTLTILLIIFILISLVSVVGSLYILYKQSKSDFTLKPSDETNKFEELEDIIKEIEKINISHRKLY